MAKLTKLDDIVSLCRRRGFIFQSSEIYGGLASCYDYGPLGVELKRNVRAAWWKTVVQMRDDVVGLDCSILMHPMVWKSSGHADKFADLVTVCKKCNTRSRVDHLAGHPEEQVDDHHRLGLKKQKHQWRQDKSEAEPCRAANNGSEEDCNQGEKPL